MASRIVRWYPVLAALLSISTVARSQTTSRVSVASNGSQAASYCLHPSISADGRFVAFESPDPLGTPGDTNAALDAFVHDRVTGQTTNISLGPPDQFGGHGTENSVISSNGRFVVFDSLSALTPDDDHLGFDAFTYDRQTGQISLASIDSSTAPYPFGPGPKSISFDGRYIACINRENQPNGNLGQAKIYVLDRVTRQTRLASADANGQASNNDCTGPAISGDGRYVAFETPSTFGGLGGEPPHHVFVKDLVTGQLERADVRSDGSGANDTSGVAFLSSDGRFVAFGSYGSNLVDDDTNGVGDVFVRDRQTGVTERVSVGLALGQPNGGGYFPALSADGRFVVFSSGASDLVAADNNGMADVFVRDRLIGETRRVSVSSIGDEANGNSNVGVLMRAVVSDDARFVCFESQASNLVLGDTNAVTDVFLHDGENCRGGDVNAAFGMNADVLFVNGSAGDSVTRRVTASLSVPITVTLGAGSHGPNPASYSLWVWHGLPANAFFVSVSGAIIGCATNPTPLHPRLASPQPFLCVLAGLGLEFAGSARRLAHPPGSAPWTLTRMRGFDRPASLTIQGVVADDGAANAQHLSVTNAVVLTIE
ncbi:MAG: hypothetical protein HYR85_01365 [Planctomycetes bacterium]|nr:hypothetical protein [Planctomycetota bacterium]MBI3843122.1 hypothetical protein [Planctomycetota bacterium]